MNTLFPAFPSMLPASLCKLHVCSTVSVMISISGRRRRNSASYIVSKHVSRCRVYVGLPVRNKRRVRGKRNVRDKHPVSVSRVRGAHVCDGIRVSLPHMPFTIFSPRIPYLLSLEALQILCPSSPIRRIRTGEKRMRNRGEWDRR